jgi:hypothetical protein
MSIQLSNIYKLKVRPKYELINTLCSHSEHLALYFVKRLGSRTEDMYGRHLVSSTLSIYDAIDMADDDHEEGKKKCVSCGDENKRLSLLIGKKFKQTKNF